MYYQLTHNFSALNSIWHSRAHLAHLANSFKSTPYSIWTSSFVTTVWTIKIKLIKSKFICQKHIIRVTIILYWITTDMYEAWASRSGWLIDEIPHLTINVTEQMMDGQTTNRQRLLEEWEAHGPIDRWIDDLLSLDWCMTDGWTDESTDDERVMYLRMDDGRKTDRQTMEGWTVGQTMECWTDWRRTDWQPSDDEILTTDNYTDSVRAISKLQMNVFSFKSVSSYNIFGHI